MVGQFEPRGAMSKHEMRYFMPKHRVEFSIGKVLEERSCYANIIVGSQASDRRVEVWYGNLADHHVVSKTARLNNSRQCVRYARVGDLGPHAFVVRSGLLAVVRRCGVGAEPWDGAQRETYRSGR